MIRPCVSTDVCINKDILVYKHLLLLCWIQLWSSNSSLALCLYLYSTTQGIRGRPETWGAHLLLKSLHDLGFTCTYCCTSLPSGSCWLRRRRNRRKGHGDREAHPVQRLDKLLLPPCSHRTQPQRWVGDSSTSWNSGLWNWLDCSLVGC